MWGTVGSGLTPGSLQDRRTSGFPVLSRFRAGKPVQDLMFITPAFSTVFGNKHKAVKLNGCGW